VEVADLSVTKVLIGDQVQPLNTHPLCLRTWGLDVVTSGKTWTTDVGLGAEAALEGPMRTGGDYPRDMWHPSRGAYLTRDDGHVDTPLPLMLPPSFIIRRVARHLCTTDSSTPIACPQECRRTPLNFTEVRFVLGVC